MPMLDGDLTAITASDTLLVTGGWNDTSSGQWEPGVLQIDPASGEVSPLFVFPSAITTGSLPYPRSLAVVDGNIYAGTSGQPFPGGMAALLYEFSGSGLLEQTIPLSYGMYALGGDDVASGPAGYTVTVASGTVSQGSNFGSRLSVAEIQGTLWNDLNGNGVQDNGEAGLAGRKVYVDANHNHVWDAGEPFALTDANGNYAITGLPPGTYDVLEALPAGWEQTTPSQGTAQQRLFTIPNTWPGQIVELDPANGSELERFATPDGSTTGALAYDGTSLFYVNGQTLWQLNPDTGAVIRSDSIEIWRTGGGYESFQGVAALDGELYLLDQSDQSLVEFDPGMHLVTRVLTLSAPSLNGPCRCSTGPDGDYGVGHVAGDGRME